MSFVKKILKKMSGNEASGADCVEDEDVSEEDTSSEDTGVFTGISDLESSGHSIDADCTQISNFFGYWKNLINQEAKFQSQLNDLSKQLSVRDAETNKLRFQMEELQRDVFAKSAGVDRLETELQTAHKECDLLKQKIRYLEGDLEAFKNRTSELGNEVAQKEEWIARYERETGGKIERLEAVIKALEAKIEGLETQLGEMRDERRTLEEERLALLGERDREKAKVEELLQQATCQRAEIEAKWRGDFEKLRTINIVKEQELLEDFEWKLREVQQTCKKRLEDKERSVDERLQDAYREAEKKMKAAEALMLEVDSLKSYELEVEKLKTERVEQERLISEMKVQEEQLKQAEGSLKSETRRLRNLIDIEKENLQHMQLKHQQEILDKERALQQTLHQKRTEIAMYWEERLLRECGRLKSELEQIHNEDKHHAIEIVRKDKEEELSRAQSDWERKMKDCLKEIASLKRALDQKDDYYRGEMMRTQTNTDREVLELRRLMDKIDMCHHNRYEKMVQEHDVELEKIGEETEAKIKQIELDWGKQVGELNNALDLIKEQMEEESQQKVEELIKQHRSELDVQWENLLSQKSEALQLVEEEYITKYKTLEEQFLIQQKSHQAREIDFLKVIDSLKNELESKESALDDLQNNVDTLEGGIQVLNEAVAEHNKELSKQKKEAEEKIRHLQETLAKVREHQEKEKENLRLKLLGVQKQSQETIDHLHRKCQCLTKLFEEVRVRYERRESRQEDLNIISDLRQVIAEQEKDLACLNEEKRYFQMRLMSLESRFEENASGDEEAFEDAEAARGEGAAQEALPPPPAYSLMASSSAAFTVPPTIPECDE